MFNKFAWINKLNEKEIQKCFDTIENLQYPNVKVLRNKKIVRVKDFDFHFSEYESVKVINSRDESYHEELNSFESVLKGIYILSL